MLSVILLLSTQANAAVYSFNYEIETWPGGSLSGMLEGTLQADGDTIAVSSVWDLAFGTTTRTLSDQLASDSFVSLSGNSIQIGAGQYADENWGIASKYSIWSDGLVYVGCCYSGPAGNVGFYFNEYFDSSNWSIQAVPLPAAAWLFFSAIGGLGLLKRFRK